jgi:outer membrane receptor protein involved in Fe transport
MPWYYTVNLGAETTWKSWKARVDITNILDRVYELRDGTGVGVGAPQYGARRGFYGGVTYSF